MTKKLFLFLFFVFAPAAFAETTVDVFIDFEAGDNAETINTTDLAASQHGSGGTYSLSPATPTGYSFLSAGSATSLRTVTVDGDNYPLSGSMGIGQTYSVLQNGFYRYDFAAHDNVSIGFYWKMGDVETSDPYGSYSLVCLYSSGGSYQCLDVNGSTNPGYHAYLEGVGVGDPIDYSPDIWYWVTMQWVRNGTSSLSIYSTDTWSLIGTSTYSTADVQASIVMMGRPDAHPGTPSVTTYFDNTIIDYTNAVFPLLPSTATTYYISPSGSGSTCSYASPCALTTANTSATAGDTVYLLAGTYTGAYIYPSNSGTSGNPITYHNYESDVVTISGQDYGVRLTQSYIVVEGIISDDNTYGLAIVGGDHNEIDTCTFTNTTPANWDANIVYSSAQYNWIHDSTFSKGGQCTEAGSDDGECLIIGSTTEGDATRYNLVEGCMLFHGGHDVLGVIGKNNTVRNNYLHNEAWSRSKGNRTLLLNGRATETGYNLIEGNRLGYAAAPCDDVIVGNVLVASTGNIIRQNATYHNNAYGFGFASYSSPYDSGISNRFYNNTIYNSGYEIHADYAETAQDSAIWFSGSTASNNVIKNNLYSEYFQVHSGYDENQTIGTNWAGDTQGTPLFISASTTPPADKTIATTPDLTLSGSSPALNGGTALTTVHADDTSSGTALIVADAAYFQDGAWAPAGKIVADYIAVGTVGNTVQISSINYATNTITLSAGITRADGDSVWLFKKSDGVQVIYGTGPDFGAYEFLAAYGSGKRVGGTFTGTHR